jgi:hypothetical protein
VLALCGSAGVLPYYGGDNVPPLEGVGRAGLVELNRRGKFVDTVFCRDVWDAYLAELKKI